MLRIIHSFKRHFHKCQDIFEVLQKKGEFKLNLDYQDGTFRGKVLVPDEDATIQFVVLLRRFLFPKDNLYYQQVWHQVYTVFSHDIPQEIIDSIIAAEHQLSIGHLKLMIDNVEYAPEQIYELISDGTYFDEKTHAKEVLEQLTSNPVTRLIFWKQFYAYSIDAFNVVSQIFEAIKYVQKSTKYKKLSESAKPAFFQCIYCLSTDNSFSAEEHVFPEALGNDEIILPKGLVCDKCNHGVLSGLDNYLVNFEPIAFLRVYFVPYDKEGKLPKANFQNMIIEKTHPRQLKITAKDRTGRVRHQKDLGDGWFTWKQNMRGKRMDVKKLGRALYKICLGTIALDHGPAKVLDSSYDIVRDFIHGKADFPNNLLIRMKGVPSPHVRITYYDLPEGTPFEIDIFGLHFLMHLAPTPVMQAVGDLKRHNFEEFPLHD